MCGALCDLLAAPAFHSHPQSWLPFIRMRRAQTHRSRMVVCQSGGRAKAMPLPRPGRTGGSNIGTQHSVDLPEMRKPCRSEQRRGWSQAVGLQPS